MQKTNRQAWIRLPLIGITIVGSALLRPGVSAAGPLDPADKAKVGQIDAAVGKQIDDLNKATVDMDTVVDQSELANSESGSFLSLVGAQLRSDIEQMLIKSGAPRCAKSPAPPVSVNSAASCWTCVSPRLILRNANGGYLENVMDLVGDDLAAMTASGLPVDVARAQKLFDHASAALAAGDIESTFTFACQTWGTLACSPPAPPRPPRSAAFAGAPKTAH